MQVEKNIVLALLSCLTYYFWSRSSILLPLSAGQWILFVYLLQVSSSSYRWRHKYVVSFLVSTWVAFALCILIKAVVHLCFIRDGGASMTIDAASSSGHFIATLHIAGGCLEPRLEVEHAAAGGEVTWWIVGRRLHVDNLPPYVDVRLWVYCENWEVPLSAGTYHEADGLFIYSTVEGSPVGQSLLPVGVPVRRQLPDVVPKNVYYKLKLPHFALLTFVTNAMLFFGIAAWVVVWFADWKVLGTEKTVMDIFDSVLFEE